MAGLAQRHNPIPPTVVPEGLVVQMCNFTTPDKVTPKKVCATCRKEKDQSLLVTKRNGGYKCTACIAIAKTRNDGPVLQSTDPERTRIGGYPFSDLRWPTSRPVR